jgi:hypothetical protein
LSRPLSPQSWLDIAMTIGGRKREIEQSRNSDRNPRTLEGPSGGPAHWDVFVTGDGKKGRLIRTDAGTTGVRTFEQ